MPVNVDNVPIFASGVWNGVKIEDKDLDAMVASNLALRETLSPPLKLGHDNGQKVAKESGLPSCGWVSNLKKVGNQVLATFNNVPDQVAELIRKRAYRFVSPEVLPSYKFDGKDYPWTLWGVAILGNEVPAIKNLGEISKLFGAETFASKVFCFSESAGALKLEIPVKTESKSCFASMFCDRLAKFAGNSEGAKKGWETRGGGAAATDAPKIETDPARVQEIQNSIREGEMILKGGKKTSGQKMTEAELGMVRRSVENAKAKLGPAATTGDIPKERPQTEIRSEDTKEKAAKAQETLEDKGKAYKPKADAGMKAEFAKQAAIDAEKEKAAAAENDAWKAQMSEKLNRREAVKNLVKEDPFLSKSLADLKQKDPHVDEARAHEIIHDTFIADDPAMQERLKGHVAAIKPRKFDSVEDVIKHVGAKSVEELNDEQAEEARYHLGGMKFTAGYTRDWLSQEIAHLTKDKGMDQDQAVAAAMTMARKAAAARGKSPSHLNMSAKTSLLKTYRDTVKSFAGTSDGASKGWETRKGSGDYKDGFKSGSKHDESNPLHRDNMRKANLPDHGSQGVHDYWEGYKEAAAQKKAAIPAEASKPSVISELRKATGQTEGLVEKAEPKKFDGEAAPAAPAPAAPTGAQSANSEYHQGGAMSGLSVGEKFNRGKKAKLFCAMKSAGMGAAKKEPKV